MPLYAADLTKIAKPVVKNVQNDQPEKKRRLSEKQIANLEKGREKLKKQKQDETPKTTPALPTPEPSPEPEPVKQKKPKRKAVHTPSPEPESEIEEPVKPKRVRKKPTPVIEPVIEPVPVEEPKIKKVRKARDPSIPPVWFEKYIEGVKKEEALAKAEKVPAKVVKQEAQQVAQKSWDNGLTRDRVSNEVDNHMTRMYSMIFNRRC